MCVQLYFSSQNVTQPSVEFQAGVTCLSEVKDYSTVSMEDTAKSLKRPCKTTQVSIKKLQNMPRSGKVWCVELYQTPFKQFSIFKSNMCHLTHLRKTLKYNL